jgi:hypothetical protein
MVFSIQAVGADVKKARLLSQLQQSVVSRCMHDASYPLLVCYQLPMTCYGAMGVLSSIVQSARSRKSHD